MHARPRRSWMLFLLLASVVALLACKGTEKTTTPTPPPSVSSALVVAPPPLASAAPSADAAPAVTKAPAWARPFLWRIEPRESGAKASYVMGTIHIPDERLSKLPPSVERAVDGAAAVFTEIPLDETMQAKMTPMLFLPKGKSLRTVLPAPLYARLEAAVDAKGVPFFALSNMKVWVVTTQLFLLDRIAAFASMKPLDKVLFERGSAAGKDVGGLETIEEQVAVFESLTAAEQVRLLEQTLDLAAKYANEKRDPIEDMLAAFLAGDDAAMRARMTESFDAKNALDMKLMKRVFLDRNVIMADRIVAKIKAKPDRAFFFAVGAGHLVADDGVVALLEKRGFSVTRVAD